MIVGLLVCYACGTAWFMVVYAQKSGAIGVWTALTWCVFPYIISDAIRVVLEMLISRRLSKALKLN